MASFTSSFVASDVAGAFGTASCSHKRQFKMNVVSKMSRIGKLPIVIPDKVKVTLEGNAVSVKVGLANHAAHTLASNRSYSFENIILERMHHFDARNAWT